MGPSSHISGLRGRHHTAVGTAVFFVISLHSAYFSGLFTLLNSPQIILIYAIVSCQAPDRHLLHNVLQAVGFSGSLRHLDTSHEMGVLSGARETADTVRNSMDLNDMDSFTQHEALNWARGLTFILSYV